MKHRRCPTFAGNQLSASGSALVRPQRRSSSSPSLLSESSESDDRGVTGLGVPRRRVPVASFRPAAERRGGGGAFFGEGLQGGTGGGLTVFVDVGAGASTGVFVVGLAGSRFSLGLWRWVTGASGGGSEQPIGGNEPV